MHCANKNSRLYHKLWFNLGQNGIAPNGGNDRGVVDAVEAGHIAVPVHRDQPGGGFGYFHELTDCLVG